MLMIRPWRSLSMRRRQALDRRNTADRLTASVCSQSSLFIRKIKASRAIPALLTRIVGIPPASSMSLMSASVEAGSAAFQTAPRPLIPAAANAAPSWAAPSLVVAVPTTVAPALPSASAMARPALDERCAALQQRPNGLRPAYGAGQLPHQGCSYVLRIAMFGRIDRADVAAARPMHLDLRQTLLEPVRGRAHQARMG